MVGIAAIMEMVQEARERLKIIRHVATIDDGASE
jgi:hypothetical protein